MLDGQMSDETYDVIIVGGGPAGLTTGIYTSRHGLKTLLIESNQLGGKAWGPHRIENFPGFPDGITGRELMERFIAQATKFGVEFKEDTVVGLNDMGDTKIVMTRGGLHNSSAVVITTGIQKKQLKVPGEMEFKGRGVAYCAICDGPFFTDKIVAVVGPGKDAVEDAIRLADNARKVYAIPGRRGYNDGLVDLDKLFEIENIEVVEGAELEYIAGQEFVTHIGLTNSPQSKLDVDGVFIILENVGTADFLEDAGIMTDEGECIIVDMNQRTNIDGIFAAGDCVCGAMQIVTAAGGGGRAGLAALQYVRNLRK